MRIQPAGIKREMIAQSFTEAAPDFNTGILGTPEVGQKPPSPVAPSLSNNIEQENIDQKPSASQEPIEEPSNDIKGYIAKKLESFGYPPSLRMSIFIPQTRVCIPACASALPNPKIFPKAHFSDVL